MQEEKIRIFHQDQLRPIGSGYRTVYVQEGRKWVYIRERIFYKGKNVQTYKKRLKKSLWETLKQELIV